MAFLDFDLLPQLTFTVTLLGALSILYVLLSNYFLNGLHRYPGPFMANFTNLWRTIDIGYNDHQHTLIKLHRKYGHIVRTGPNTLSISNWDYIPKIYGVTNGFPKSNMYDPFSAVVDGDFLPSLLSERNEKRHLALKKPVMAAYSNRTFFEYEPLVDDMTKTLTKRLDDIANSQNKICDMALWLRRYAFDVIMHITFGHNLGFMGQEKQIEGLMETLDNLLSKMALMTTIPWTAQIGRLIAARRKEGVLLSFTRQQIHDHLHRLEPSRSPSLTSNTPLDFVDRCINASQDNFSTKDNLLLNWTLGNFTAGGDTTSIALCSIMYYLVKNPSVKQKLVEELHRANLAYPVSWQASQQIPYLDACVKEALRLHPPIGLGLERVVQHNGLQMPDGYTLPPNVHVSMNAWVVNRQPVFGLNTDAFVPERWLQTDGETPEAYNSRLSEMKRANLTFGAGSRACIGKQISFLEIYKVIPTLLLRYDFELVDIRQDWHIINRWTVRQTNFDCRLKMRM